MAAATSRRNVLRSVIGLSAGVAFTGRAGASGATLVGRLVTPDGDPIGNRRVRTSHTGYRWTDADGRFELSVESNSGYRITMFKSTSTQLLAPVRNGVPHICSLGVFYSESGRTDLGDIEVPRAHLVRGQAVDEGGHPMPDAQFHVYNGSSGSGHHALTTDSKGRLRVRRADFDGIELVGYSRIHAHLPVDGGGTMQYDTELDIDGPRSLTFQLGSGVRHEEGTTEPSTTTPDTTPAQSTTTTATTRTRTSPTADSTGTPTTATTQTGSTDTSSKNRTTTRPATRGFFSNTQDADVEFLSDPFVLTVGGFVISIAGIAHQMLWGQ